MATYSELSGITNDAGWIAFADKVRVAALIKAAAVIDDGTSPAARLEWAKSATANPGQAANAIVQYVVAKNAGLDVATIIAAADNAIQNNVDAAVNALYV